MEPLGKVVNFSAKGSLIVKAASAPTPGQTVADRRQRPIGRVVRITGPVSAPYVIVAPVKELETSMNRLLGTEVFILSDRAERPLRERVSDSRPGGRTPYNRREGPHRRPERGRGGRERSRRP